MRSHASLNPALSLARNEEEVLVALRDYLPGLTTEEMALVPSACKMQGLKRPADVGEWAVALARADCCFTGNRDAADALHAISIVFAEASRRIAQMAQEARLMTPRADGEVLASRPGGASPAT